MELIDKAALMKYPIRIDHYDKEHGNEHFVLGIESVLEFAEQLPTIDAVEVRHGTWEPIGELNQVIHKCENGEVVFGLKGWKYCPNCGAKMDGRRESEGT